MKYGIGITLILIGFSALLQAQVVRGFVYENATSIPVAEADIYVIGEHGTVQLQSDSAGKFTFEPTYGGRFDFIVSHLSFELVHLPAVQVGSAKDLLLEIPMTRRVRELNEVNILAPTVRRVQNRFYTVTEEETRRLPATFFDPARAAALFPGVYIANDQANQMVIHGLNPDLMQWYIEGVPILNPNHLANAGTLSDRASLTGGGVNMISNQVLSSSTLVNGALPTRYGDAVSGVMDMQFRQGNERKYEHTLQAGLLGLEAASEGPLSTTSKASYLVNYRYSFVGLLTALGVDFGDEKIGFQDINVNVHVPFATPGAYVKFFGVGGLHRNRLDGPLPVEEREDSRDISNVDYRGGTGIVGTSLQWPTQKGVIKATAALSRATSMRDEDRLDDTEELSAYGREDIAQTQISSRLEWQSPRSNRVTLNMGLGLTGQWIDGSGYFYGDPQYNTITRGNSLLLRPFGQLSYVLTGDIVVRGGVGLASLFGKRGDLEERDRKIVPEPSLHIYWQAGEKFSIESGYSYSGMTTPRITYQYSAELDPDLLRTHTFSFIFRNQIRQSTQLAGIIHYYGLSHVPADADTFSSYTILGDVGSPHTTPFSREGKGRAISLALSIRQELHRGSFMRAGVGWINASHTGEAHMSLSTPYDIGPWAFLSGGKEWTKSVSSGERAIGVNGSIHWRNGMLDQEINLPLSQEFQRTFYQQEGNFEIELEDYFRVDLRIYLRKDKPGKSSTWSLDIQNVSGKENAAFSLYDTYLDQIRQQTQLGIIPVLSYRVDF